MTPHNLAAAVLLSALVLPVQTPQQAPAAESFKLTRVDVAGVKRYTPFEVIQVSGLKVGQSVVTTDLNEAARRLASTGLFKNVKYQYVTSQGGMVLTFQMEEEAWTTSVVFDNFIWFTDDELTGLVRQSIPQFNRVVPSNAGSSGFLQRELQHILEARSLPGRVEFTLSETAGSSASRAFVFSVAGAGAAVRVCAVRFDGAAGVPDNVLQDAAQEIINADYSQSFTTRFASGTLTQLYHRRGFWKAVVSPPRAAADKGGGCGGVTVTIPVAEGPVYTWDHAEWTGNAVVQAKDLDAALAMKAGDIADVTKLEAGLRSVRGLYGKQGYVQASVKFTPRLDDAARKAVFEMAVTEGQQFFMGTLEILGLQSADEANLRKKWSLEPGSVYDESYLTRFLDQNRSGRVLANTAIRLDPATRQVTVRIEFR